MKTIYLLTFIVFMKTQKYIGKIGVKAEYDRLRIATVFSPGNEINFARLHYESALYKGPVNIADAKKEHEELVEVLTSNGVAVFDLRQGLRGLGASELRKILHQTLTYVPVSSNYFIRNNSLSSRVRNKDVGNRSVEILCEDELVDLILLQPEILLKTGDGRNSQEVPEYKITPLSNIIFARDQSIVTDHGIVLGKMRTHQRNDEVELIKIILESTGHPLLYRIQGDNKAGFLEGGDYIPCGSFAMIGCGLRSDMHGIQQLFWNNEDKRIFGFDEIVVINYEKHQTMVDMHLDTWLNILNPRTAVVLDDLLESNKIEINVWTREGNVYYQDQNAKFKNLKEYLITKGIKEFIKISRDEQKEFATNFLAINQSRILCIKNPALDKVIAQIKAHGVDCIQVNMPNLTNMYGATHCLTNALYRGNEPVDLLDDAPLPEWP